MEFRPAFTLIEALVAIAIVLAAVVGPIALLAHTLSVAPHTRASTLATSLVREPIEYLTNLRDRDFERAVNFFVGGGEPNNFSPRLAARLAPCQRGCTVDPLTDTIHPCSPDREGSCRLYYSSTRGVYSHQSGTGWSPTTFERWIVVERPSDVAADPAYRITSVVRYRERRGVRQVSLTRFLYPLAEAVVELYRRGRGNGDGGS